ncbi:hypothetical protein pb186bvf_003059 [Paramecium bursaria]
MKQQSQQQSTNNTSQRELKVFNNQFIVRKKLSSGSFGVVFQGEDKLTGELIALKIEKEDNEEARSLDRESHMLSRLQGVPGIPKLYWLGQEGPYNIMVIQLLGRDLAYYVKHLKKFSLKSLLMLAEQLIIILQQTHERSIVHRDMKPENVLVGIDPSEIYLVDFGISKVYKDQKGQHIPFRENKPFIGTTRYASIAAHKGHELGRVDDLESLGYMLIFLYKGQLPWQNLQNVSDKDKTKIVGRMKMAIEPEELCKDLPKEFMEYFTYIRSLTFKQAPDYKKLINLMRQCAIENEITFDFKYDWYEMERRQSEVQSKQKAPNSFNRIPRQSAESEKNYKNKGQSSSQDKRPSIIVPELQSSGGNQSQFDFLKIPDPYSKGKALIQRTKERHKSVSSLAPSQYSHINTFQSSIANQYQNSMMVFEVEVKPKSPTNDKSLPQQNFGFLTLEKHDRSDTMGFQFEEDESGPQAQYLNLKERFISAHFKDGMNDRRKKK